MAKVKKLKRCKSCEEYDDTVRYADVHCDDLHGYCGVKCERVQANEICDEYEEG